MDLFSQTSNQNHNLLNPKNLNHADFGVEIKNSKKAIWASRKLLTTDLEDMNQLEKDKFITRDSILDINPIELINKGIDKLTVCLIDIVSKRISKQPRKNYSISGDKYAEYINVVKFISDFMNNNVKSKADFSELNSALLNKFSKDQLALIVPGNQTHYIRFNAYNADIEKATALVNVGYPEVNQADEWRTKYIIRETDGKFRVLTKKLTRIQEGFNSLIEAEEFAKNYKQTKKTSAKLEPKDREIQPLDDLTVNYTGEDLIHRFGIKGGQFGNYQNERQAIINNTHKAFSVLANIINVNYQAISLDNDLSIAYGARGSSKAMAHYEPMYKTINLTKANGAGCLAHEWAHALDHYLADKYIMNDGDEIHRTYLSDNLVANYKNDDYGNIAEMLNNLILSAKFVNTTSLMPSNFIKSAYYFDSGKKAAYWATNREIFARLFECYVFDKMIAKQNISFYLVSGLAENPTEEHSIYPQGEERIKLNNLMEVFLEEVAKYL